MIKITKVVLLTIFIFTIISCTQDDTVSDGPPSYEVNILSLGDSRVEGNRPNHESYRFDLWKNFIENNWTVNFLGTNIDNSVYPQFLGLEFDKNHSGFGGYTTELILNTLENTLVNIEKPNVVLLGVGGNDLIRDMAFEDAITNIHRIIDMLQENNPDITIFIEQIAPAKSNTTTQEDITLLQNYNDAILEVTNERTSENSKVISIDMATGWNDILLADDVHYNALGAKVVADRYFDAIDEHVE